MILTQFEKEWKYAFINLTPAWTLYFNLNNLLCIRNHRKWQNWKDDTFVKSFYTIKCVHLFNVKWFLADQISVQISYLLFSGKGNFCSEIDDSICSVVYVGVEKVTHLIGKEKP